MQYFDDRKVEFESIIDWTQVSAFDVAVWQATSTIPYGQTRSYGWVAAQIGKPKAARAVGQALGRNPTPILIPCHRVITSSGKLGGFSSGIDMKQTLLDTERNAK
ncbi:MAG: MGMT family protein [Chloroflexi bacterium]|nr:MGMT family protein [Chloroflexota bacterium]MBT7081118.1 MGMT family protein [Chloroflexota bacterium]MBT7289271.1 MGMT family protein [Chloroflexota bacterium]